VDAVAFLATHRGSDANPPGTAGETSPTGSAATDGSPKAKPKQSPSTSSGAAGSEEAFIRDYYDKAPGGSEEAWAMLAPSMQSMGHDRYLGFWRTIESVDVRDARPTSDGTVEVTLVYRTTDGRTSTEHKREVLSRSGDGFRFESDEPAS
jgi:hypothetical protein